MSKLHALCPGGDIWVVSCCSSLTRVPLIYLITCAQFVSGSHLEVSHFVLIYSLLAFPILPASGSAPPKVHYSILTASECDTKGRTRCILTKWLITGWSLLLGYVAQVFEVTVPVLKPVSGSSEPVSFTLWTMQSCCPYTASAVPCSLWVSSMETVRLRLDPSLVCH